VVKDLGSYAFNSSEFFKVMPEGQYTYRISEKNKSTQELNVSVDKDKIFSNGNYVELD
jgi:VCBS repeat-containing protein